jgi:uncharacterized protein HemX
MDLAIGVLALIVAGVSLGMVVWLRGQVAALQAEVSALRRELEQSQKREPGEPNDTALRAEVSALRRDLEQTQRELGELKAATEITPAQPLPAPPLPKVRPSLDDLREQLRAAHRESDNPAEE